MMVAIILNAIHNSLVNDYSCLFINLNQIYLTKQGFFIRFVDFMFLLRIVSFGGLA